MAKALYSKMDGTFQGKGGIDIAYQAWVADKPNCLVIISHGLGGHSGRFMNLIEKLGGKKISFYAIDHRGHGASQGKPGHVDYFLDYIQDLKQFVNMVLDSNKSTPVFMFGFDMGGVIASKYVITYQGDIDGLILSSPMFTSLLKPIDSNKVTNRIMAKFFPSKLKKTEINFHDLTHDENAKSDYVSDQIVHNFISYRLITELIECGIECMERSSEIDIPVLALHGSEDNISDLKGTECFIEGLESSDRTLEVFQGLYHELFNEKEKERNKVISSISKWIQDHLKSKKNEEKKDDQKSEGRVMSSEKTVVKKSSAPKKAAAKKPVAKKAAPKKAAAKKPAAKKAAPKKAAAKKPAVKKAAPKKAAAKKPVVKKAAPKKAVAKKTVAKKAAPKKAAAKKSAKKSSK